MTSTLSLEKEDRWPLYRRPRKQFFIPITVDGNITQLSLPRAKRSNETDLIPINRIMELNEIIFGHYNSYLAEREKYGNFVGEHIATRRHEVLDCDPYFGGLTFVGDTAYMIVHDERFQRTWCLAPGYIEE